MTFSEKPTVNYRYIIVLKISEYNNPSLVLARENSFHRMKFFTVDLLHSKLYYVKDHPVFLFPPPGPSENSQGQLILSILFLIPGTTYFVNMTVNHSSLHTWLLIYPDISQNLLASHDCILRILGKHISNFSINFDMHESHPGNFISTRNILC